MQRNLGKVAIKHDERRTNSTTELTFQRYCTSCTMYLGKFETPNSDTKLGPETMQKSDLKIEKWPEKWPESSGEPIVKPIAESIVESIVENLSAMRARIVWILWKNPHATAKSVSQEVGIAPRNVQEHFRKLQEMGIIRRDGGDFGGRWEIIVPES